VSVITAPTVTCAIDAEPVNLDFEDGVVGEVPTGWSTPTTEQSGYAVEINETEAKTGTRSVLITKTDRTPPADAADSIPGGPFGNVMQVVDAAHYRGTRVSFSRWVRTNVSALGIAGLLGGQAQSTIGPLGTSWRLCGKPRQRRHRSIFAIALYPKSASVPLDRR